MGLIQMRLTDKAVVRRGVQFKAAEILGQRACPFIDCRSNNALLLSRKRAEISDFDLRLRPQRLNGRIRCAACQANGCRKAEESEMLDSLHGTKHDVCCSIAQ